MDGAMHDDLGKQNNDISLFFQTNGVKDMLEVSFSINSLVLSVLGFIH
jgi:hypothetical protein